MKKTIPVFILMLMATVSFAQSRADIDAAVGSFQNFYNHRQADSIFNMLSDRAKGIMPLEKTRQTFAQLNTQLGQLKSYEYTKEEQGFSFYKTIFSNGVFTLAVALDKDNKLETFRFLPHKEDTTPAAHDPSNIVLKTTTGNIYGTLTMPQTKKKVPVVLIIAGSGPTDRNCNSEQGGLKSNAYKMIADSLLQAGIACVRYDKRGVGESAKAMITEDSLRFENGINDADGIIEMLKADPRFSKIIIMGHSEGSLTGMVAARKEKAAAYISISGAGEKIDKILVRQLRQQSGEMAVAAKIILDSLDKGYIAKEVDPALLTLFRPSIQPYMMSWLKYDPVKEIKKLAIPILILQGTTDIQVSVEDAENLKKANPKATLKLITGMNHVLKDATENYAQNVSTYSKPELPLSAELMPAIVKFIKAVK